jgi:hypothetical protein
MSAAKQHIHDDDVAVRGRTSGTFQKVPDSNDDHAALHPMLAALHAADVEHARGRLATLYEFLVRHFEREESAGGFFDFVLDHAPWYQARVRALRLEHAVVLTRLEGLAAEIDVADELPAGFEARIQNVIRLLNRHERQEHSMMQHALQIDIALGD